MNYKLIWKISLVVVIAISAIMAAPSILRIYELSDAWVRILGVADAVALCVLVFSFVKSCIKR